MKKKENILVKIKESVLYLIDANKYFIYFYILNIKKKKKQKIVKCE